MANIHSALRHIILRRLLTVGLWHAYIQTLVFQFIASVDFGQEPLLWLTSWISNLFRIKVFGVIFLQVILSTLCVFTESNQYLKASSCECISRIRYILRKLSLVNLLWFFVYFLRGVVSVIVFCATLGDSSYPETDSKTSAIRNSEIRVLLLINSIWMTVLFFLQNFVNQKSFKYFPLIQRHFSMIVPSILSISKDACVQSLYYCSVYTVFHLIIGYSIYNCLSYYIFSITDIVSYSLVLKPFILCRLWLFNVFLLFNNSVLMLLFDIFLTRRLDLPIVDDANVKQDSSITIKDAMAVSGVPVLRYLGYYDLNIVTQFDLNKRKQIFTLSYPGGHPYIWRKISSEAVKFISDTAVQLENITSQKPTATESNKFVPLEKCYSNMRSLSPRFDKTLHIEGKQEIDILTKVSRYMQSIRPVAYLLEDMTEKQIEAVLQHFQSMSLACYSLANLAANSKSEDKFGIVQQDLSVIIQALLRLYVALNKLGVVVNRRPNASILQVKRTLSSVTKSSLYKISVHFGKYAKDFSLAPDDEKLFHSFINFKN